MPYELVILDFDGTLADSGAWFRAQFNDLAPAYGFRCVEDHEVEALRRMNSRQILSHLGIAFWKIPILANTLRKRAATAEIALFDGVGALLEGIRPAIVSSNSEANVRRILGPLTEKIAAWHCGRPLHGKAHAFMNVVKRLKIQTDRVLCVGDEVRDIEAAHKAGLDCAAVTWGYAHEDALTAMKPRYLVRSMAELRDLTR